MLKTFDEMTPEQKFAYKIGYDAARRDLANEERGHAKGRTCERTEEVLKNYRKRAVRAERVTEALDRGYRDWTFGDPLHKIDLSALDAIIEAATEHERWADFPTDEDVEVAAKALFRAGVPMEPYSYPRRKARVALQAVADTRRTEDS